MNEDITLKPAQQRAARTLDRNITVEAGAGSGKTTTLTERYLTILRAHLDGPESLSANDDEIDYRLPDDIDRITDPAVARRLPERIVVTTFTDRAAEDLKQSIREKIRDHLEDIDDPERWAVWRAVADGIESGYIDTTHGFCSRILEEYAITHPAVDPDFEVMEEDDAKRLLVTVVNELVEAAPPETRVLAPVFDRQKLADVLVELVVERDMTEEWIEAIRKLENPGAYEAHLVDLHPFDADPQRLLEAVQDDLETLYELYCDEEVCDRIGTNPMKYIGNDLCDFYEEYSEIDLMEVPPVEQLQLCIRLCKLLTSDGDRYADGSYYGNKSFRTSDDPDATQFREAMDSLLETLTPETRQTDASLDPDRDAHDLLLALADLAEMAIDEYTDRKQQRGVLDYTDLINHTLTFLTDTDSTAVDQLRDDIWYVMVDEFQDTNTQQWKLVQALTSDADPFDADNVCVVGDIKQSIYRFRDADVTVFGDATSVLQTANTETGTAECNPELTTNFRTLPETLQAINGLFDDIFAAGETEPYEAVSAPLIAGRETPPALDPIAEYIPVPVETDIRDRYLGDEHGLTALPESEGGDLEATAIANRIATLLNTKTPVTDEKNDSEGETRPIEPNDIAVLIRSRSDLKDYERGLRAAKIPYTVVKGEGFFETPEIRAFTALLSALADPTDDIALYAAARSPLCGLSDTQLATAHTPGDDLWESLQKSDDPDVQRVVDDLERWRTYAGTADATGPTVESWVMLADRILAETGYLTAVAVDERGTTALANIDKLRDKLRELDTAGTPSLERVNTRLADQAGQGRAEAEANNAADATGVRIMTVHEAKGQEYPVVIVPGLGKEFNDRARISNGSVEYEQVPLNGERQPILGLKVPTADRTDTDATLMRHVARDRRRAEERAEEKRILYVACTRAKDHLILTGRHTHDSDHEAGIAQPDLDEPTSYRDLVQPALFGTADDATARWNELETDGKFTSNLEYELEDTTKHGSVTVRLPPDTETYDHDPDPVPAETFRTSCECDLPWEFTLSASDLSRIPARAVEVQYHEETNQVTCIPSSSGPQRSADGGVEVRDSKEMPAAIHGHAVHRLCETRPPRNKWRNVIQQAIQEQHDRDPGITDVTYQESAIETVVTEAERAIEYIETLHETLTVEATYDEYPIELSFENGTIRGFIDHLIVTPDTYHIIDYKTDQIEHDQTTDEFLASRSEHHRPQLRAYAAALSQQDPTRDVTATLYFTAIDESYTWEPHQLADALSTTATLIEEYLSTSKLHLEPQLPD